MSKVINNIFNNIIVKLIIAIVLLLMIVLMKTSIFKIVGHSMNPTLYENERVIAFKVKFDNIKRGDIIAFNHNGQTTIKRVIGLPDDVVDFIDDKLVVNGKEVDESYVEYNGGISEISYPYRVPSNELFVLGDNRSDSLDSRIISFGNIKREEVLAKVIFSINKPRKIK